MDRSTTSASRLRPSGVSPKPAAVFCSFSLFRIISVISAILIYGSGFAVQGAGFAATPPNNLVDEISE